MKFLPAFLLFITTSVFGQIDFSSVDAFWEISKKVKQGTATDADWDKVFATPYYKFYENWNQRRYMRSMITLVYTPSKQKKRDSIIALGNWNSEIIKHLLSVDSLEDELQAYRDDLNKRDLVTEVILKVTPWLPPSFVATKKDFPAVAFGIFQPDGHAGESVAMDLKRAMTIDVVSFMAHEAHHFYTYKVRVKFKDDEKDSTYAILKAVGQLQLEGIADMIDKEAFLKSNGKGYTKSLYDKYVTAYNDPVPALRKVDSLLVYISKHPAPTKENSNLITELLPLGAHPHGYYMATTILRTSGKKALLATIANPFDFIREYNRNARQFKFSKAAMNYLAKVESNSLLIR